jgi:endonuclease YncB( thermonuclease family)
MARNKATKKLYSFLRKALFMSAFFLLLSFPKQALYADNCTSEELSAPESAAVKFVYDGDTLLLTDKRKIRIIGIDTPETKHHKQKGQPYGAKATEALRALLKRHNNRIQLRFSKQRRDRYSRTLAHVFLADGTNVSNWLLERGYAAVLPFPPNIVLANCYKTAEESAQLQSIKIWQLESRLIKEVTDLTKRFKGNIRLRATVKKIKHNKKYLTLELESNSKRKILVKIKNKNLRYFKEVNLNDLTGNTIIITGKLKSKRKKWIIYLNHPSQLSLPQTTYYSPNSEINSKVAPTIKWSKPD